MTDEAKALNAQEAAEFLNAHVETVRRLARKGQIPSFKVGKDWRFRSQDLIQWARTQHLAVGPPTVLVVDDEQNIRDIFSQLLEKKGYRVIAAEDGKRGLKYLQDTSIRLILLDLQMPEINGVEFLDALRKAGKAIPVILVTGHPDGELMQQAMQYSPLLLIPKPFETRQLLRAVQAVAPMGEQR